MSKSGIRTSCTRQPAIDAFKFIASFLVVAIHTQPFFANK